MWDTLGMTMTVLQFGLHDHIRKAIEVSGLSVGEFSDALGVSRNTASRWLSGRREPSRAQLIAISMVTRVPLEWLLGAAETPPADAEGVARPKGLEPLTFCSVADLEAELDFWALVEPIEITSS